jgi:hypothetical protein
MKQALNIPASVLFHASLILTGNPLKLFENKKKILDKKERVIDK